MFAQTLCWCMLLAGAGWILYGLFRSLARFRHWRAFDAEDEGEIVVGDGRLAVGQIVELRPLEGANPHPGSAALHGSIVSIGRRYCEIAAQASPDGPQRPGGKRAEQRPHDEGAAGSWCAPGSRTLVSVTASTELYRFKARIRDARAEPCGVRLYLARPAMLVRVQRRRHARAPLCVPATFERVPLPATEHPAAAMLHGTVRDLSAGGLRAQIGGVLRLSEIDVLLAQFRPESILRVGLPFPALPRNSVLARVLSCGRAVTPGGLTVQVTCEFLPMPSWEQEIVIQHVFQFQREQLKTVKSGHHGDQSGIP